MAKRTGAWSTENGSVGPIGRAAEMPAPNLALQAGDDQRPGRVDPA